MTLHFSLASLTDVQVALLNPYTYLSTHDYHRMARVQWHWLNDHFVRGDEVWLDTYWHVRFCPVKPSGT